MTHALARPRASVLFVHWGEEGIRGSERVLLDLFATIDRDRFAPVLWCNAETMAEAARSLNVPTRVSSMPILLGWDAPKFDIATYRSLIRQGQALIEEHSAALVHANSGAPSQWMVPAARRARVPLVAHLHGVYGLRDRCTMLLHQAPVIVGCSRAVVRPFRADGVPESRVRVVHNGVDPERLNRGDARGLRAALNVSDNALLIVSAGALIPLKGMDVVLRALEVVTRRGIDAHLAIAGDGPERGSLEGLARDLAIDRRVHFLGARDDLGAIFRDAADLVAVGSHVESFGLVAAEAGALGVPAVATRVGGIEEVVQDAKTGLLVNDGDHVAFADAVIRLSSDTRLRRTLGEAARARVLAHFTTGRAARAFEHLYSELPARPSDEFGWFHLGFRLAPFARLGMMAIGRRMGLGTVDA
jgi:glycosyltransferase involved in cell wall biosynthesis